MTQEGLHGEVKRADEEVKIPDAERWLNIMGYGHLKGVSTGWYIVDGKAVKEEDFLELGIDGEPVPAEEFDKLCGPHVRPVFRAIEADIEAAKASLEYYLPRAAEEK